MRYTESMRVEQTGTVTVPCILVSYYRPTMTQQEYLLVRLLVADLRSTRVDVVTDEINDWAMQVSPQVIQRCQWILLVQTADGENSVRVKARIEAVPGPSGQQRARGVLRVLISPAPLQTAILDSTTPPTFDASRDYPRALAGIVLTVSPDHRLSLYGVELGAAPPPVKRSKTLSFSAARNVMRQHRQFASRNRKKKPRLWLIILTTLLILGIIVTSFLIGTL